MKELIQNNYYWVLRYKHLHADINEQLFNELHKSILLNIVNVYSYKQYIFKSLIDYMFDIVNEPFVPCFVFNTQDDFLIYLVNYMNKLKYKCSIDNYMKNKIEESKFNHPEKWI